jgi:hypothetical protein
MFVQRGEPVNAKDTTTNVTTASTACDYIIKEEMTFKYANPLIKQLSWTQDLPTITSGQFIDPGSGEIEDVVSA